MSDENSKNFREFNESLKQCHLICLKFGQELNKTNDQINVLHTKLHGLITNIEHLTQESTTYGEST